MTVVQEPESRELVIAGTGEVVELKSAATNELARIVDELRDLKRRMDAAVAAISGELSERMDREACWTFRLGGYEIRGTSPAPVTAYDAVPLRRDLQKLVKAGAISEAALEAAIEREVSFKVKAGGIKKLEALGGEVAEAIAKHKRSVPRERRPVTVKPLA